MIGDVSPPKGNPLFAKRWFADDTIIRCVNWYLRFKLSYRVLAQIMGELGIRVAPCTILRWVIRYAVDFVEAWTLSLVKIRENL